MAHFKVITHKAAFAVFLAAIALLSGCALPRMIDSDVSSFVGSATPAANATFEFERLPSQAQSASQDVIEAMATEALRKVGLNKTPTVADAKTPAAVHYKVQVNVQVSQIANPHQQRPRPGFFLGMNEPAPLGASMLLVIEPPWYRHAVQLVLRDSKTAQVAFETTATFDGPWADSLNLLPAVMDAALRGYPAPTGGTRKVVVELPANP